MTDDHAKKILEGLVRDARPVPLPDFGALTARAPLERELARRARIGDAMLWLQAAGQGAIAALVVLLFVWWDRLAGS